MAINKYTKFTNLNVFTVFHYNYMIRINNKLSLFAQIKIVYNTIVNAKKYIYKNKVVLFIFSKTDILMIAD